MSKIIEPSKEFSEAFIKFIQNKKGCEPFFMAEESDAHFKQRYNTTDKWTDSKNITGFVKRKAEQGEIFEYLGEHINPRTKQMSKMYRLKEV